jgi:hypothetical protein
MNDFTWLTKLWGPTKSATDLFMNGNHPHAQNDAVHTLTAYNTLRVAKDMIDSERTMDDEDSMDKETQYEQALTQAEGTNLGFDVGESTSLTQGSIDADNVIDGRTSCAAYLRCHLPSTQFSQLY